MTYTGKITTAHVTATRMRDPAQLVLEQAFNQAGRSLIWRSVVPLFAADPQALDRTGPIHVVQGDPHVAFATGTLLYHHGRQFLITAAHVLADWNANGYELRVGADQRPRPLMPAIDKVETDSDLDISVIRLKPSAARFLARGNGFLRVSAVSCDEELVDGQYVIGGYLAHECRFNADKQSLRLANSNLWTRPIRRPSDTGPAFGFLEFPVRPTFDDDLLGATEALPTTGGLSGACVWRICRDDEDVLRDWKWDTIRVVGVQVSECVSGDRGWIKCVLWKYIMPLVDKLASTNAMET